MSTEASQALQPDKAALMARTRADLVGGIMLSLGQSREQDAECLADRAIARFAELYTILQPTLHDHGLSDDIAATLAAETWEVLVAMLGDTLVTALRKTD